MNVNQMALSVEQGCFRVQCHALEIQYPGRSATLENRPYVNRPNAIYPDYGVIRLSETDV